MIGVRILDCSLIIAVKKALFLLQAHESGQHIASLQGWLVLLVLI